MRPESSRTATGVTAQSQSLEGLYHRASCSTSKINDILARLLFSLESRFLTSLERAIVLDRIEGLIRLRIDAGLLMEGKQHGR